MKTQKLQIREPERCWVGEVQKVCYGSMEEAEGAARLVEYEQGLRPGTLAVYSCEYGGHWHLANRK